MPKQTSLSKRIRKLTKKLVNATPDGPEGFAAASDMVSELWSQFEEEGATVEDVEQITGFIRWKKFEGFCAASPIK